MGSLLDLVKVQTATTGTGTVAVGSPSPGMLTPEEAGALDGGIYTWLLSEGNDKQIFVGAFDEGGNTVSRDRTIRSKIAGVVGTANLSLLGNAILRCVAAAESLPAGVGDQATGRWGFGLSDPADLGPARVTIVPIVPTLGPELVTNGTFTGNADGWATIPLGFGFDSAHPTASLAGGWAYGTDNVQFTPGTTGTVRIVCSFMGSEGTGYNVGNILTLDEYGDGNATVEVLSVDGFGGVLTLAVVNPGTGYIGVAGTFPTGGDGTGLTVGHGLDGVLYQAIAESVDGGLQATVNIGGTTGSVTISGLGTRAAGGGFIEYTDDSSYPGFIFAAPLSDFDGTIDDVSLRLATPGGSVLYTHADGSPALLVETGTASGADDIPRDVTDNEGTRKFYNAAGDLAFGILAEGGVVIYNESDPDVYSQLDVNSLTQTRAHSLPDVNGFLAVLGGSPTQVLINSGSAIIVGAAQLIYDAETNRIGLGVGAVAGLADARETNVPTSPTLGPELVTNGTFDTDASGWQVADSLDESLHDLPYDGWSWDSGHLVHEASTGVIISASPSTPGSGYLVGDILDIVRPTGVGGQVQVASIDGSGGITALTIVTPGTGYPQATGGQVTTGGTGTDATVTTYIANCSKLIQVGTPTYVEDHHYQVSATLDSPPTHDVYARVANPISGSVINLVEAQTGSVITHSNEIVIQIEMFVGDDGVNWGGTIDNISIKELIPGGSKMYKHADGSDALLIKTDTGPSNAEGLPQDVVSNDGKRTFYGPQGPVLAISEDSNVQIFSNETLYVQLNVNVAEIRSVTFPDKDGTFAYLEDLPAIVSDSETGRIGFGTADVSGLANARETNVPTSPTLGSELVTNGTFDTDASGWQVMDSKDFALYDLPYDGWSWDSGHLVHEASTGALRFVDTTAVGSGYTVSDILDVIGESGGTGGQIQVDSVNGGGGVTAYTIVTPGTGYGNGSGAQLTTGGTGTGVTVQTFTDNWSSLIQVGTPSYVNNANYQISATLDPLPEADTTPLQAHISYENNVDIDFSLAQTVLSPGDETNDFVIKIDVKIGGGDDITNWVGTIDDISVKLATPGGSKVYKYADGTDALLIETDTGPAESTVPGKIKVQNDGTIIFVPADAVDARAVLIEAGSGGRLGVRNSEGVVGWINSNQLDDDEVFNLVQGGGDVLCSNNVMFGEVPAGGLDGVNTVFQLSNAPTNEVIVVIDGLQVHPDDYIVDGGLGTVTFTVAPIGTWIRTHYIGRPL